MFVPAVQINDFCFQPPSKRWGGDLLWRPGLLQGWGRTFTLILFFCVFKLLAIGWYCLMHEISEQQSILVIQGPFNYLDMLPSPPEEIGTVFLLYTQQNRELHQVQSNSPPLLIIMMCHVMSGSRVQQRDDGQQQFLQRLVSDQSDHPRLWIFQKCLVRARIS